MQANNKKLTSDFLFLAADMVGGWQVSSSVAGADTWKRVYHPGGFGRSGLMRVKSAGWDP